jgi:REP element-mobilizing transposase RayT
MKPENSLNHSKWECKYHIGWIPKYRKKSIYKDLRKYLGATLKDLALEKECTIEEGHLMSDHVYLHFLDVLCKFSQFLHPCLRLKHNTLLPKNFGR